MYSSYHQQAFVAEKLWSRNQYVPDVQRIAMKRRQRVRERRFMSVAPSCLQFDLLGNRQRVIDLYPEVADGAFQLRVTE